MARLTGLPLRTIANQAQMVRTENLMLKVRGTAHAWHIMAHAWHMHGEALHRISDAQGGDDARARTAVRQAARRRGVAAESGVHTHAHTHARALARMHTRS